MEHLKTFENFKYEEPINEGIGDIFKKGLDYAKKKSSVIKNYIKKNMDTIVSDVKSNLNKSVEDLKKENPEMFSKVEKIANELAGKLTDKQKEQIASLVKANESSINEGIGSQIANVLNQIMFGGGALGSIISLIQMALSSGGQDAIPHFIGLLISATIAIVGMAWHNKNKKMSGAVDKEKKAYMDKMKKIKKDKKDNPDFYKNSKKKIKKATF